MNVNYHEYIRSDEWKAKADAMKWLAGYRCQVCNSADKVLDAHHRTYERLGHEEPGDITVLCRDCHELFEANKKAQQPTVERPNILDALRKVARDNARPEQAWVTDRGPMPQLVGRQAVHASKKLVIEMPATGDSERDVRRHKRLIGLLQSYPGHGHFVITPHDFAAVHAHSLTLTGTCEFTMALYRQLNELVGADALTWRQS